MLFHCIETITFLICGIPSCFMWVIRYMTIDLSFSLVYFGRETFNDLKNMNTVKIIYLHCRCYQPVVVLLLSPSTAFHPSPWWTGPLTAEASSRLLSTVSCYSVFTVDGCIIIAEHQVDWFPTRSV